MVVHQLTACAAVVLAVVSIGGASGCSAARGPAGERLGKRYVNAAQGVEITVADGWRRATHPLTPRLKDPRERLSAGTFSLRYRPTSCEAFAGSAQQDLGHSDAFFTVLERGQRGSATRAYPARPKRFGAASGREIEPTDCPDSDARIQWIEFTDAGRYFNILLAFGPSVPPSRRRAAYSMLNSLRFDPNVRPDWPASP